jgi:hypothetical protein
MKLTTSVLLYPAMFLLVACIAAGSASSDETQDFIAQIIRDSRTNSERFAKLADAVSLAPDNKQLRIALLEKAVGYGTKNLRTIEGCTRVSDALTALGKEDVERKPHWLSRNAVVLRRICVLTKSQPEKQKAAWELVDLLIEAGNSYASGGKWKNAIAAYKDARSAAFTFKLPNAVKLGGFVRSATYLYRISNQIDACAKALKESPGDEKARTNLVPATLTAMNDPAAAAGYVNDDLDERLQMFVPLAARDTADLPARGCRNLADWYYKELAASSVPIVKRRMLRRAEKYYGLILENQGESGTGTAAVKLAMMQIKSKTAKLLFVDPMECSRCGGAAEVSCPDCVIKGKSSGLNLCDECKGTGRGECPTCDGNWGSKCSRCKGTGKPPRGAEQRIARMLRRSSECPSCSGTGVTHGKGFGFNRSGVCPACAKGKPVSERGKGPCRSCNGKGGTSKCGTCLGTKTSCCTHCQAGRSAAAKEAARRDALEESSPEDSGRDRPENTKGAEGGQRPEASERRERFERFRRPGSDRSRPPQRDRSGR